MFGKKFMRIGLNVWLLKDLPMATFVQLRDDVLTSQLSNSNNIVLVYISTKNYLGVLFVLLLFKLHQNCASQTLLLLYIAIFGNWFGNC